MISLTLTFVITAVVGLAGLASIMLVSREPRPEQAAVRSPAPPP